MLTSVLLHLAAGVVTGSVFTIPVLLALLVVLVGEAVALAFVYGPAASIAPVFGIVAVQAGYLAGLGARGLAEHYALVRSGVRARRMQ